MAAAPLLLLLLLLLFFFAPAAARSSIGAGADPLIGSGGGNGLGSWSNAMVSPGAMLPFACMRLGPDTTFAAAAANGTSTNTWFRRDHYGGHAYNDTHIVAFSHTHIQGGGMDDLGNFGIMPTLLPLTASLIAGSGYPGDAPYKSAAQLSSATAAPGLYAVSLLDAATDVELTISGTHSGIHRYTCAAQTCALLFDVCHVTHDSGCPLASLTVAGPALAQGSATWTVNASVRDSGDFAQNGGGVMVYFSAVITAAAADNQSLAPAASVALWEAGAPLAAGNATVVNATSGSLGALLSAPCTACGTAAPVVFTVRAGISFVDAEHAAANLAQQQQEPPGSGAWMPFEDVVAAAAATWEATLAVVAVGDELPDGAAAQGDGHASRPHGPPRPVGACPSPIFDSEYMLLLSFYMLDGEYIVWKERQGLAPLADIDTVASHIRNLSCYAPPAQAPQPSRAGWLSVLSSALYRAFSAPTTYSEWDGAYLGLDRRVHTVPPGRRFFSDLSLWDTHRTHAPLLAVLAPGASADLAASLVAMTAQLGRLPMWPFASVDAGVMCGNHGVVVLADALLKGVPGIDAAAAYAVVNGTLRGRDPASQYATLGYIPLEEDHGYCRPASLTLEWAFNDGIGAGLAAAVGDGATAALLRQRSLGYARLWNATAQTLCPRHADGTFYCDTADLQLPHPFNSYYTEGNSHQWQWFAPHDVAGLVALFPSPQAFADALEAVMANATTLWPYGNFLPNKWFWAGNEPSLLLPWQFVWAGNAHAWRTQRWTRQVLSSYYWDRFDGIPGNDDYGTMAAWAVWAMLGLYPVAGTPQYVLGSPSFSNVTLQLPAPPAASAAAAAPPPPPPHLFQQQQQRPGVGAPLYQPLLTILAHNASGGANVYVSRATLDGAPLPTPFVNHSQLFAAGSGHPSLLEFFMTDAPCVWGSGAPV